MEDRFEELQNNELYSYLRRYNDCRITFAGEERDYTATFQANSRSVYFVWASGFYERFELVDEGDRRYNAPLILGYINRIVRIERQFDDRWLPVWTAADGFLTTDGANFLYLRNRYYTVNELEQMIDEVNALQRAIANLRVY